MFCLSVLLLNSMSKRIDNRCTCERIIKTLRLHTWGQFLKGGINYTRYNSYSSDKSAILGITIRGIKMGSRKHCSACFYICDSNLEVIEKFQANKDYRLPHWKNTVPFSHGNFRKFAPDFLVEW